MRYYIIVGALAMLFFALWRCSASQKARAESNVTALMDSVHHYRTRDSMSAASCATLELTVAELKRYRQKDVAMIKSLGLRLSRVNTVANVATVGRYSFELKADSSGMWRFDDRWSSVKAEVRGDTLKSEIRIRDTIVQILHRVPRFKILGIWFGTRGVRQEVISKNPHTEIVYADYVEIKRK